MSKNIANIDDLANIIKENNGFIFKIRVIAGAKVSNIEFLDDYIKIKIQQKPIEGKANKAIIEYLSKILKIPKTKIEIINGQTSSIKTVEIKL